jgi:uncharacterized protein DUF6489
VKLTIEVDCSPEEARAFLGLPDVQPLNQRLVDEMQTRLSANLSLLSPDELLKNWAALGVGAQDSSASSWAPLSTSASAAAPPRRSRAGRDKGY